MNIFEKIIRCGGFVTSEDLNELVKVDPDYPLCIKWSMMPREMQHADQVAQRIANVESNTFYGGDYVREVFVTSDQMRVLEQEYGILNPFNLQLV